MIKILVVDDEPYVEIMFLQKFRTKIKDRELAFDFAENGLKALEKLANDTEIDIVFSDINMPQMNGLALLDKIKEQNFTQKTVMISAYGDMENIRLAMNRGAFDFIVKPIDFNDLETTLNKAILETMKEREANETKKHLEEERKEKEKLVQRNILISKQKEETEKQKKQIEEVLINLKKTQAQLILVENQKNIAIEKTRIARDMHDDIGSGLTQIAILSELLKSKETAQETLQEINKISAKAKELVDNMSQIIWAMNPENDKLQNLLGYLRKFSLDYFENSPIECNIKFPDNYDLIELSNSVRRNLFLVIKETFHNIIKHSNASIVNVEVLLVDQNLEIVIQDNGKGFDIVQSQTMGNGLSNMKKRMTELNGTFHLQSEIGKGSLTKLDAPVR